MLILLVLGAVLHVHSTELDGTPCLICINARATAPTPLFLPAVVLVPVDSVSLHGPVPHAQSSQKFSSFIRPPPVA